MTTSGVNFSGNCIAFIGSGTPTIFTTGATYTNYGAINILYRANNIIDNIRVNGTQNGYGLNKAIVNAEGIVLNGATNSTINNVMTFNNGP